MNKFWVAVLVMMAVVALFIDDRYLCDFIVILKHRKQKLKQVLKFENAEKIAEGENVPNSNSEILNFKS